MWTWGRERYRGGEGWDNGLKRYERRLWAKVEWRWVEGKENVEKVERASRLWRNFQCSSCRFGDGFRRTKAGEGFLGRGHN